MKRRQPTVDVCALGELPAELMCGRCIEVWAPGDKTRWLTTRRYRAARAAWLAARGIGEHDLPRIPKQIRASGAPWSFEFIRERDPAQLALMLSARGLPQDWRPVYVKSYDYGRSQLDAAGVS